MARCPHPEVTNFARRFPCTPCEFCKAHIDEHGNTMTAAVALQRFPQHAENINGNEARWHPAATAPAVAIAAKPKHQPVTRSGYKTRKEYRFAKKKERRATEKRVLVVLAFIVPWLVAFRFVTGSWATAALLVVALYVVGALVVLVKVKEQYQGDHFWRTLWAELRSEPQNPPESI